jgi:hypothetical protein
MQSDSFGRSASATPLLFDVVGVSIKTGEVRAMGRGLTEKNAEALVSLCVMRRGCDEEFFKAMPASSGDATSSAESSEQPTKTQP